MRKTVAVMVAGLIMAAAPAASAEPVKLSGDAAVKYQRKTADGDPTASGAIYTLKLMSEAELGDGWSLYARLGAQSVTAPTLADFNIAPEVYGESKKSVVAIDQFGLNYKTDKLTYKLGRQDAGVGTTTLLYHRADSKIGKKVFVDGLSVAGTVGIVDIAALAAREDNPAGSYKNNVYAVRAGINPVENFNWGVTLGRFRGETESTNHWAVDGTYKFGKSSLTAEYTKASSSTANKAYAVVLSYDFDDKTSASVTGFRVEEFGSMGGQSEYDANNRGIHYAITRKLRENAGLELVFKDQKTISGGQKNTSFEATVSYSF
ncbi:porin [Anaeroselena agilis]|uniref:Porin n=1 Tax=Anaeroselena agilis TaxID=3063788 RepID=A0ABU3NVC9_9FIRM|nr:porin [Selenomonadales bacterium 4137-cl]